ncbi:MAG: MarR family transcriptional regulator [Myxococcales bacterium]|nr:MarR family transcriptional regulator [Myxococcales bacterium]
MRVVWAVDHGLHSTSKRMSAALGVTGPQRLVIRIVGKFPGISAGRLADILHVHKSTLTGVLRRLEERGVLERKHDSTDGRRAVFDLTARGRELDAQRAGTVEAAVRRALARVPAEKILIAQAVLQVLATELESDG